MASNAIALSILTTAGVMFIWKKLPLWLRNFFLKHDLLTDVIALVGTYLLFGGTVTALMAGALVGIYTSALLYIAKNPEEFVFLDDMFAMGRSWIRSGMDRLKNYARELSQNHRATLSA